MSNKIGRTIAALVVLTLSGTALAQAAPCADPYIGTYAENVYPYSSNDRCADPYSGTIWEDVAPY